MKTQNSCRRLAWCALVLLGLAAARAHAITVIDVTAYGAVPNGSTDDTTAIQNAINAAVAGDTIYFPGGTYNISSTLTFLSNLNYAGEFAGQVESVLNQTTANKFGVSLPSSATNISVTGLTFQNGGFAITSGSTAASGIDVQYCTFQNINNTTYPYNEAIYISIGATNCNFVGNTFDNVMGDNGMIAWNLNSCSFTDNSFNTVNEGCHLNGTCTNMTVARNIGVNMHRMGIEIQGSGYSNLLVEDNDFSNWASPYDDSFGLSIVQSSGPNVTTQYNTIIGRPAPGSGSRYGFGIEVGSQELVQNNFVEGYFWHGIIVGGANVTIENNIVRGPTNGSYQQPATINFEPGGDPNTTVIANNLLLNTPNYVGAPSSLQAATTSTNGIQLNWVNNPSSAIAGSLNESVVQGSTSTYNLTALGTTDWAHWNGNYVHKAAGGGQISNVTAIGGGNYGTFSQSVRNVSWTDGTPTGSNSDDQAYIWCNNKQNAGWTFTVPADTTSRTLNVLYGGPGTDSPNPGVTISAHLSDSSAPDVSNTQTITSNTLNVATFIYNAASAGQTLTITLTKTNNSDSASVDLDAAWLTTSGPAGLQVERRNPGGAYATIATLAQTAASYTDSTAASDQEYIYRLYVYDANGDETYSPAVLVSTRKFEAENLTVANYLSQAGGTARQLGADTNLSNSNGEILDSNTVGDYITFVMPNVAAGSYDVRVGVKNFTARGQFQLQGGRADNFSGTAMNIGGVVDEYAPDAQYMEIDLGIWSPGSTSDKWFRFNVAGKNSASGGSSYNCALAFDYIKMIPQ